jgi:hypothetical protein
MNTEVIAAVVVDPKQFGLEETKASEMVVGLAPTLAERDMLVHQYEQVIQMELGKPAYKAASELRKRIKENRTKGIEVWHKNNKEFYLRGGQFVDAIKRKESLINEQMEARLEEIEKHEIRMEQERIAKLQKEREGMLLAYEVENVEKLALGTMDDLVWENFLSGTKSSYEARKEAERLAEIARIENERLDSIERARTLEVSRYAKFITEKFDLRNGSDSDYQIYLAKLVAAEIEYDQEQARLKAEAEELRKKNEEAEAKIRKAREEAEAEAKKAKEAAEVEARRVEAENQKRLDEERKQREAIEAELKRKQDEEAKAEAERKAEDQRLAKEAAKLAKAPVKKQLNVWIDSITTEIPTAIADDETAKLIYEKFESFKNWAKQQIDSI